MGCTSGWSTIQNASSGCGLAETLPATDININYIYIHRHMYICIYTQTYCYFSSFFGRGGGGVGFGWGVVFIGSGLGRCREYCQSLMGIIVPPQESLSRTVIRGNIPKFGFEKVPRVHKVPIKVSRRIGSSRVEDGELLRLQRR